MTNTQDLSEFNTDFEDNTAAMRMFEEICDHLNGIARGSTARNAARKDFLRR